jgi:hypothetical protein
MANNILAAGENLLPNGFIQSDGSGTYKAIMETDGNFAVYQGNTVVWASNTVLGQGAYFATMQSDGNFVLYKGTPQQQGQAYWNSGTSGPSPLAYFLIMQSDGNLVIYRGSPIWATNTQSSSATTPTATAPTATTPPVTTPTANLDTAGTEPPVTTPEPTTVGEVTSAVGSSTNAAPGF